MSSDIHSQRSSITSVFHDLLGDGLAKQVAEQDEMVQRTIAQGESFVSRQRRETSRGADRKFSISTYRRLGVEEAIAALQGWSRISNDTKERLAVAMRENVPVWHVVVRGVDFPRKDQPVSIYFLQNLDELKELVYTCLVEFLDEDDPSALSLAIGNSQFQDWCRQWYLSSEDVKDERSIRYPCRLKGCAVLTHCIRNNFEGCVELLLSQYSDKTAPEPWLVLAEPLRYFGKFQGNAFHEAAYCGSLQALEALVAYGKKHRLQWRQAVDVNGKTPLQVAESQMQKARPGCEACFQRLKAEEPGATGDIVAVASTVTLAEGVLLVWSDASDSADIRFEQALPSEATWEDLCIASEALLAKASRMHTEFREQLRVMVYKAQIVNYDADHILRFLQTWRSAAKVGFFKSQLTQARALLSICKAVDQLLRDDDPPCWQRLYVFGAASASDVTDDVREQLPRVLRSIATTIATRFNLRLWKLERFPAVFLSDSDRHVCHLPAAALDVKSFCHQVKSGTASYRFFWTRLEAIERNMLDRMRLLNDPSLQKVRDAVNPQAQNYIEDVLNMWLLSIGGDNLELDRLLQLGHLTEHELVSLWTEVDSALEAALRMTKIMPCLPQAFRSILSKEMLHKLPETARALSRGPQQSVSLLASTSILRPSWASRSSGYQQELPTSSSSHRRP
eukprot:TRINITY_DN70892_c0_g1_i1.p1 TRINITY_DN70892_c0_g1~~TRINITY_DN70892_c0_g1_i1.p1  ORF type:complete len:678 (-),score=79.22 TRINITY_DN70892_c0_g1_i1:172-2205(-)